MKEESNNHPSIEPELEARIVALVLGEASDFECDELNRLIDQRPELATLKEQMQSVHGLLGGIGAGESVAEDEDWKLPAEKRNSLLAVISGEVQEQPATQVVNKSVDERRSAKRNLLWNLTKIAAVFCFVGFFGLRALVTNRSANWREVATSKVPEADDSWGLHGAIDSSFEMDHGEYDEQHLPATVAEPDHKRNSKSALSAIRGTLDANANGTLPSPFYLSDDVQYFPAGPGGNPPRAATEVGEANGWKNLKRPSTGVGGPGPGRLPAEKPAPIAKDKAAWSSGSRRTAPQPGSGELSFPRFDGRANELSDSGPATVRSTVRVADGGTVLLGGIKRLTEGRGEVEKKFENAESGGESLDPASEPMALFGSGAGPEPEGAATSPGFPKFALGGSQGSGQGQSQQSPDTSLGFPAGLEDSLAAGKEKDFDEFTADGNSQVDVDGGFGGGGLGGGGGRFGDGKTMSIKEPEGFAMNHLDLFSSGEVQETPPSQPQAPVLNRTAEAMDESFDTKVFDTARIARSIPSSTNQPAVSREDLKKQRELAATGGDKEESAQEGIAAPGDDDIALYNGQFRRYSESFGVQIPEPVAGTAMPRGELQAGQAIQNNRWSYQAPVKNPQERLPATKERYRNSIDADYDGNLETYSRRDLSKLDEERGELRRRLDQVAIEGQDGWHAYVPPMLEDSTKSAKKKAADFAKIAGDTIARDFDGRRLRNETKKSAAPAGLNEKAAQDEAFSTFSLHVSDVSFKLAQAALAQGEWPAAAKVRIEEFVNAFDYGDPMPCRDEKVACQLEQSIHPFLQQRNLLRVSMRTAAAGRSSNTPLRLTLLLDNSGSMERIDRQQTVRRAFALLAQQLTPIDQVTLISFARQPRLLADKVSGTQSQQLVRIIDDLPSEGGTNIEAALQLAFEKAREQQVDGAQNRIILLTDGAVNLGDANPESLSRMITTMRDAGIAFDAAGISAEGLNDEILEALTRKGDGRYYLLDSLEAADDGFARQIAGALRPSAKNVKVQIEFNPKRVGRYKLLGFEKHLLKQEDFRNDKVDAAEMAAAEAGVAVYQFEAKPDGEGDVGSVSVRFRDLSTGQMIENRWPIPYQADAPRCDQAAPSLRIATSAALLAAKLRGEPLGETVDLQTLSNLIASLPDRDRNAKRVGQLQLMIGQAREISGK